MEITEALANEIAKKVQAWETGKAIKGQFFDHNYACEKVAKEYNLEAFDIKYIYEKWYNS